MNQISKWLSLVTVILALAGCAKFERSDTSLHRILFVGNSLTYHNDVPAMVSAIYAAVSGSRDIEVDLLAEGGISIEQHLAKGVLKSVLTDTSYDFVVLQDFGGWPNCITTFPACSSSSQPLSTAVNLVKMSGARPIWYSTYHADPINQHELSYESHQIALELNLDIADIGAAMLVFLTANISTDILHPDHHPNTLGSWIVAATITRALIGKPLPESVMPEVVCRQLWQGSGLTADQLASMQKPSKKVCDRLEPEVFQRVIKAANKSFSMDASDTGVG